MNWILLLLALVMIACILCNKLTSKIGMPVLLAFLAVGMLCGVDGPLHIRFDNYALTETLCTVALIFIIFYGGFGTKWRAAKPVAGKAVLLVSLELDEVMNLSDRILVMYEGEIVGEFDPKKVTVEELGLYMAGAKRQNGEEKK